MNEKFRETMGIMKIAFWASVFTAFIVGAGIGVAIGYHRGTEVVKALQEQNRVDLMMMKMDLPELDADLEKLKKIISEMDLNIREIVLWNKYSVPQKTEER